MELKYRVVYKKNNKDRVDLNFNRFSNSQNRHLTFSIFIGRGGGGR